MQSSDLPDSNAVLSRKCPYLGIYEDKTTWSSTDQVQNYCHLFKKPEPVEWDHQSSYCFRDEYLACPLLVKFQSKGRSGVQVNMPTLLKVLFAILLSLGLLGGAVWYGNHRMKVLPAAILTAPTYTLIPAVDQSTPTSTRLLPYPSRTPTAAMLPSATQTVTQTKTPLPTASPTPTDYRSPTPGPGLMTPFGMTPKYLVHNVAPGDNLELIAIIYNTSEEVLRSANGLKARDVLWVNVNLVVLPGVKDASGVEPLKAVYIEKQVSVQAVADQYKIDVALLRSQNGLENDEMIPSKRWLVIPAGP